MPSKALDAILKKHPNAVLLDRAQYEALIRDAGKMKPEDAAKPSEQAVINGIAINVSATGGAAFVNVTAKLSIQHLVDGWVQGALLPMPDNVRVLKVDGREVIGTAGKPWKLAMRGKGLHEVNMEFQAPVTRGRGVCSAEIPLLGRPCTLTFTSAGNVKPDPRWLLRDGVAVVPVSVTAPSRASTRVMWEETPTAGTAPATLTQHVNSVVRIAGTQADVGAAFTVESSHGSLPEVLRFQLADALVHVVSVRESNIASWRQDGAVLEITRAPGLASSSEFVVHLTRPAPAGDGTSDFIVDVPRLIGAARISANAAIAVGGGFELAGWDIPSNRGDADFAKFETEARRGSGVAAAAHYEVAPEKIIARVRRLTDRYSADVDLHALVSQHELALTRTVAFHGEEGSVQRATFTLPVGEQFLSLARATGEAVEWKQIEGGTPAVEITWPKGLSKGQNTALMLSTRKELPAGVATAQAAAPNAPPPALALQNLAMPDATRLAGYLALDFDESWKVATPDTTGLESRDARFTPVKGRMAWFHLRDYRLAIELSRHEPVLDAAVTAFALPRARTVEIEGQVAIEVTRAPLRTFAVKLPPAVAPLLRWDSPLIGERKLDDATGTWTLTLRKELMGLANLRWHLSLAGEEARGEKGEVKGDATANAPEAPGPTAPLTLTALLPRVELPTARRFNGAWVIEANTDTEISFESKALQPLDALRAPRVEGYAPRHRVLAAYGYGSAPHELRITATRHESTRLVSAVVETFTLISVLARDGTARHETSLRVRHNGDQFFAIRLPGGATLLSTSVEHNVVKPVTAGQDEVRVPLPRSQGGSGLALVTVLYATKADAWGGSGKAGLQPPAFDAAVPVLTTAWRVYAPEGYSYVEPETTLVNAGVTMTPTLASVAANSLESVLDGLLPRASFLAGGSMARPVEMMEITPEYPKPMFVGTPVPMTAAPPPVADAAKRKEKTSNMPGTESAALIAERLNKIILPQVQFRGASVEEAIELLRNRGRDFDTTEGDHGRRGVNIILKPGAAPSTAQITLDLKDVPMSEALKYITELAGMKYKIEPQGVVIVPLSDVATEQYTRTFKVPPDFLAANQSAVEVLKANGITFPQGSSAVFVPATSQLVVKNTQPNLDQVDGFFRELQAGSQPADSAALAGKFKEGRLTAAKSGLLPVKLELPATGRVFEFRGNQKPEVLTLRYQSWERQLTKACFWLLVGFAMFAFFGRRRPWWRTLIMVLVLTCAPLALLPSWLAVCNALLAGWLLGLAVWLLRRLARWVERAGQGAGSGEQGARRAIA